MNSRAIILIIFITGDCFAQTPRIDSLKHALPGLSGKSKVDCLNELGGQFFYYWVHSDSALKYSRMAEQEASRVRYFEGQCEALVLQGEVHGRLLGHPDIMESKSRLGLVAAERSKDPRAISLAYYSVSLALSISGNYLQAVKAAEQSMEYAVLSNDRMRLGWASQAIGFAYIKSGRYWMGFEHLEASQAIGKEINDSLMVSLSLALIGRSFNNAGNYRKALAYYYESLKYAIPFFLLWPHVEDMAHSHMQLKQFDSVLYYQQKHRENIESITRDPLVRRKFLAFSLGYSIEIQIEKGQYDSVLAHLLPRQALLRNTKDVFPLMHALVNLGKVYEARKEYDKALKYSRELIRLAESTRNKFFALEGNRLLASVFGNLGKNDSAYHYFRKYTFLKDSMEIAKFEGRTALYLAASAAESRIRLLEKDKKISEQQLAIQKKELLKQSQLRNLLVTGIIILLLFSFLVVRNIGLKRKNDILKNDQAQSALKRKAIELEMQALRAQMNPHFIFNCLSAIDSLVQTGQPDKATAYLSRFAKLIRAVLDSSKNNLVPFQKDFETLQLYLEMEQFRCNGKFQYEFTADMKLMHGDFKVPPLIIQPFVENAIHHGLLNKKETNRQLFIRAELTEDYIVYQVKDNGIGRKEAAILKERNRPGQKSYGIDITRERINLYNKNRLIEDVVINDLEVEGLATGTHATIRINNSEC